MAALGHRLDVAVVGSGDKGYAGSVGISYERGEELVVGAQHDAGARIIEGVPRHVGLEELVKREVVLEGDAEEMLGRALGSYDGDFGIAILYRLARDVLHHGSIFSEVVDGGYRLGCGQRHYCRDGLEAARGKVFGRLHKVGVRKADPFAALLQLEEKVVLLYYVPQRRTGEALAVLSDGKRTVYPCEHRRLAGRGLRQTFNAKA